MQLVSAKIKSPSPLVAKEAQRNKQIFTEDNDFTFSKYFVPERHLTFKVEGLIIAETIMS